MSKRVGKSGTVIFLSSIVGLMTSCGPPPQQPTNVKPIPVPVPSVIAPTPLPGSSLLPVLPGPGQTPLPGQTPFPGSTAGPLIPTPPPSVGPGQLAISTGTLPTAALSFTYTAALSAVGGSGSYRWNLVSGSLPNGLILDQATGQIFGKPTQTGTFNFEIQAIDTAANASRRSMFILVSDTNSGINSVGVLTTSLASGTIDRRYSQTINAGGGTAPYSWSISSGALPDGLSINASTGEISGTPKLQSEETFTVKVVDARGQVATKALSITINRTDSNISILTAALPIGIINRAYVRTGCGTNFSGQLAATGGNSTYTWEVSSGTLPAGLTLSSTGNLTGTPTATGSATFTVRVADNDNNRTSKVFTVEIRDILVHRFSPNSGGEGLRMVVEGENFGGNADVYNVEFGGTNQTTISAVDNTTDPNCHRITLPIPATAKTGVILVKNTTTGKNGSSTTPFLNTDIVLNEVFTNPDNSSNQFVELLNKGSSSASIAGWHLRYTDVNGATADFTIPSETPPLAPGAVTVININRAGGSTATNLYTGTGLAEMRFNPTGGTNNLTQVALCTDSACTVSATDTNYRDYLQFGPNAATDGAALENNAVTSGLWTNDATIDATGLVGTLDTANITNANAHNGTNDGTGNRGLLLTGAESGKFAANDVVVVDNLATGGKVNRLKRTVNSINGTRVTIDSALFTSNIQSTNTGNGSVGNGLLVDKITDTFSALTVSDFVNVLAGGTIRTIQGLPTTGPRVELDNVLFAQIQAGNTSDGTNLGGFVVDASSIVTGSSTVSITVGQGTGNAFTVVRNLVSTPDATHIIVDQSVAAAPVPNTNLGDGMAGTGISVSSIANFVTGRTVSHSSFGGQLRTITLNGSTLELNQPLASLQIAATNTGTGASGSEITVNATTGFNNGDKVRMNGQVRTIANILSTPARVQLDQPISMTITNTTGDGTAGSGVGVAATQGFASGNQVLIAGQQKTITIVGNTLELNTPVNTTITAGNNGDGGPTARIDMTDASAFQVGNTLRFPTLGLTRTVVSKLANSVEISAPLISTTTTAASTTTVINMVTTAGLATGNLVRFPATGEVSAITVNSGTQITLGTALAAAPAAGVVVNLVPRSLQVNLVPTAGTIVMQNNGNNTDFIDVMNLVPTAGSFNIVPVNPAQDRISRIPTSGTVLLAPTTGTVRKFFSIKYSGSGNAVAGLTATSGPNAGTNQNP